MNPNARISQTAAHISTVLESILKDTGGDIRISRTQQEWGAVVWQNRSYTMTQRLTNGSPGFVNAGPCDLKLREKLNEQGAAGILVFHQRSQEAQAKARAQNPNARTTGIGLSFFAISLTAASGGRPKERGEAILNLLKDYDNQTKQEYKELGSEIEVGFPYATYNEIVGLLDGDRRNLLDALLREKQAVPQFTAFIGAPPVIGNQGGTWSWNPFADSQRRSTEVAMNTQAVGGNNPPL